MGFVAVMSRGVWSVGILQSLTSFDDNSSEV